MFPLSWSKEPYGVEDSDMKEQKTTEGKIRNKSPSCLSGETEKKVRIRCESAIASKKQCIIKLKITYI